MKKQKKKKVRRIVFTTVSVAIPLAFLLFVWTYSVEGEAHFAPEYPMEDIAGYLEKEDWFKMQLCLEHMLFRIPIPPSQKDPVMLVLKAVFFRYGRQRTRVDKHLLGICLIHR